MKVYIIANCHDIRPSKVCGCYSITFLIGHIYLIGVWLGGDQSTKSIKRHVPKRLD